MPLLVAAFFLTALLYASVGFGGGSTYTALLALAGVDYRILPLIALSCNIAVVAGSTVRFSRSRVVPWRGAAVLTALAAPAALLGGLMPIEEKAFYALLGASLLVAGGLLLTRAAPDRHEPAAMAKWMPLAAPPLGFLAGVVGIGGGIFLAPLLHLARWNTARAIAATASFFILVNSLFGLVGQVLKGGEGRLGAAMELGLPLLIAVVVGGQIGSLLALKYLSPRWIRLGTAVLAAWVGVRLLLQI